MNLVVEITEELNNGNLSFEQVAIFNDISSGNRTYNPIKRENENIKDVCQSSFNTIRSFENSKQINKNYPIYKLDDQKLHSYFKNLCSYNYKMKNLSSNELQITGSWPDTETENLLIVLEEGYSTKEILYEHSEIVWPCVSKYVLGRTGESCRNRYNYLKKKNTRTSYK